MEFVSNHLTENKQDESLIRTWTVIHTKCSTKRRKTLENRVPKLS